MFKKCEWCKQEFKARRNYQKFCCKKCANAFRHSSKSREKLCNYRAVEEEKLLRIKQLQSRMEVLRNENAVKAVYKAGHAGQPTGDAVNGEIIAEYSGFYLVRGTNYNQTILKNDLMDGTVKVVIYS